MDGRRQKTKDGSTKANRRKEASGRAKKTPSWHIKKQNQKIYLSGPDRKPLKDAILAYKKAKSKNISARARQEALERRHPGI